MDPQQHLDGVLFCLGLATSRGMRADRLPDLINSGVLKAGKAAETTVSVRFDLSDWTPDAAEQVSMHRRKAPGSSRGRPADRDAQAAGDAGASYSSSYSADGFLPCNSCRPSCAGSASIPRAAMW